MGTASLDMLTRRSGLVPFIRGARLFSTAEAPAQKIKASQIAAPYCAEVRESIKQLPFTPKLVGFLANDDPGARQYAEWTGKACERDGVGYELREVHKLELESKLREANSDPSVNGILIYYPCFGSLPSFYGDSMDNYLRDEISYEKDVEGLCHTYRRCLYHNQRFVDEAQTQKSLLPCTPLALVKVLESDLVGVYDKSMSKRRQAEGKTITVINRSPIVGHPVAAMLANDGADVYSVDVDSIYLMRKGEMRETRATVATACQMSDVIITGVPTSDYRLDLSWVKPGTTVINVSPFKNLDEKGLMEIPGVKYVPRFGQVTVSMLERNLVTLIKNFQL